MSETTNLKLKKHDNVTTNTSQFDIQNYMNRNWDKLDQFAGQVNENLEGKVPKVEGKGLSSNDFTNEFKAKLEELENYDDTEVKQDILNLNTSKASKADYNEAMLALQAELKQAQEEIERQNKDYEAGTLEGQDTGESLYLSDSSDARFREFNIEGNSKQETRSGKNKLDLSKISQKTFNGITCTYNAEEKSVTLNGTCTKDNTGFAIDNSGLAIETLVKDKTTLTAYYVSGECSGTGTTSVQAHATGYVSNIPISDLSDLKSLKIRTATYASANYPNAELCMVNIRANEGAVLDNFTFKLMLTEDVDTEYEEYGAMPSLEFPSEIETVKDSVNVTVCNKNRLDFNRWNNITASHGTIEQVENKIKLTATANDCYTDTFAYKFQGTLNKDKIEYYGFIAKPNTKCTFSCKVNDTTKSKRLAMFFSDKDYNAISYVTTATSVLTATTPENCKYITIRVGVTNAGDSLTFTDLQVEEGEATDYIAHEEQVFTMPIQQEMLEGDKFEKVNGVWKEKHMWSSIAFTDNKTGWFKSGVTKANAYGRENVITGLPILTEETSKCTHFKYSDNTTSPFSYASRNDNIYLCFPLGTAETLEEFKSLMQEQTDAGTPVIVYYQLAEPQYLDCTPEQIKVLDKIEKTLHSYKGGTHVYSVDEISPIFNVRYTLDQKAYIKNEIANISKEVINNV